MQLNKPNHYNNLDKVYLKIWDLLKNGLADRNSSFHIPTFICGENENFGGRIVVLRGISAKDKRLWFHSDIRSNKIKILKINPLSSLIFYDKNEKIQLRVSCSSKINYQNEFTKKSWSATAHMSRQCYLGDKGPGTISKIPTSGLSTSIDNLKYTIEESEIGYKNFCVIENFINSIEWLFLAAKGHRRAIFTLNNDIIEKKWINP